MACSSLFAYLVTLIGYAPASAQRRIDAARMMQQVTELGKKIEEGRLKLTQVSQAQQAFRLAQKKDKTQILPTCWCVRQQWRSQSAKQCLRRC
jgi:hypothetical protein